MQIIFRNVKTNQELIMPVTPSDFYVEDGRQVESLDMTDTGQVNLPGLKSLFNEQKEFLLPSPGPPPGRSRRRPVPPWRRWYPHTGPGSSL